MAAPLENAIAELLSAGSTHALADFVAATRPHLAERLRESNPFANRYRNTDGGRARGCC
jgi:hypothetical protein